MPDISYYHGKIAECIRMRDSSTDPLNIAVYEAMANEFKEKMGLMLASATPVEAPRNWGRPRLVVVS